MLTFKTLVVHKKDYASKNNRTKFSGISLTVHREVCQEKTMKTRERKQVKTHGEKFPEYMEKRFKKTCEVQGSEACKFEDNKQNK